jgi:hypothetical protein
MNLALFTFLIIISIGISTLVAIPIIYLIYWIAQFFKQKSITEQQKNKKDCYTIIKTYNKKIKKI